MEVSVTDVATHASQKARLFIGPDHASIARITTASSILLTAMA
jgi:hypothetical protein